MLVETVLGIFGLAWTEIGIARLWLPHVSTQAQIDRVSRAGGVQAEPNRVVADAAERVRHYAMGERVGFSGVPLDLNGIPRFYRQAYEVLLGVPWGDTTTYGAIARQLGDPALSRAVGQAMGRNPIPLIIPCHRVLAANGKLGGFSAPGGGSAKLRMLELEQSKAPAAAQLALF